MNEIIPILNTDYKPALTSEAQGSTVTPHYVVDTDFKAPEPYKFGEFEARMPKDVVSNALSAFGGRGGGHGIPDWRSIMNPNAGKIELTRHVPKTETHKLLGDGKTWIPKYESYTYGLNNEETLAMTQSSSDKNWNTLKRFGSNTLKGLYDVAGGIYGIGAAALTGRIDAMYNNDFAHWIDKQTELTNFEYKNYYTQAQKDAGLGFNAHTFDKVMGGAEFTSRMIFGEAIMAVAEVGASIATGGTTAPALLAGKVARIGSKLGSLGGKLARIADRTADGVRALDRASDMNRALRVAGSAVDDVAQVEGRGRAVSRAINAITGPEISAATRGARISDDSRHFVNLARDNAGMGSYINTVNREKRIYDLFDQARFVLVTPSYEAGLEARHFEQQARDDFYNHFQEKYKRAPTSEEVKEFSKKMGTAANSVFAMNMAILGVSNMAIWGDMLGVKNPFTRMFRAPQEAFNKAVLGIGTRKTASGVYKGIKGNFVQKGMRFLTPMLASAAVEGVFEEGGQGIASRSMLNYVSSSYSRKAGIDTSNFFNSVALAFNDQFGTKEGQEEVIIGAIIGGLFGGFNGGMSNVRESKNNDNLATIQNSGVKILSDFKSNLYGAEWLRALGSHANRFQKIREDLVNAENSGDIIKSAQAKRETFVSLLQAYNSVGREADFVKMMTSAMQGMDVNILSEKLGISVEEADSFKKASIQELKDVADTYKKAYTAGRYLFKTHTFGGRDITSTFRDDSGKLVQRKLKGSDYAAALAYATSMGEFYKDLSADTWTAFQRKVANSLTGYNVQDNITALGAILSARQVHLDKWKSLSKEYEDVNNQLQEVENKLAEGSEKGDGQAENRADLVTKYNELKSRKDLAEKRANNLYNIMTQGFFAKMGIDNFGTTSQLKDFMEMTSNLDEILEQLPESDRNEVENLINAFNQATKSYNSFADMADKIQNPNAKIRGTKGFSLMFDGLVSKAVDSKDDITAQEVKDALQAIADTTKTISSESWKYYSDLRKYGMEEDDSEEDDSTPPEEEVVTEDIDTPSKLSASIAAKNAAIKILEDFDNGIYPEAVQSVIDELKAKIEESERKIDALKKRYSKEYAEKISQHAEVVAEIEARINELESGSLKEAYDSMVKDLSAFGIDFTPDGVFHKGHKISDKADSKAVVDYIESLLNAKGGKIDQEPDGSIYQYKKAGKIYYGTLEELLELPSDILPLPKRPGVGLRAEIGRYLEGERKVPFKPKSSLVDLVPFKGDVTPVFTKQGKIKSFIFTDSDGNVLEYSLPKKKGLYSITDSFTINEKTGTIKSRKVKGNVRIVFSDVSPFSYNEKGEIELKMSMRQGVKNSEGNIEYDSTPRKSVVLPRTLTDMILEQSLLQMMEILNKEERLKHLDNLINARERYDAEVQKVTAQYEALATATDITFPSELRGLDEKFTDDITQAGVELGTNKKALDNYINNQRNSLEQDVASKNKRVEEEQDLDRKKSRIEVLKKKLIDRNMDAVQNDNVGQISSESEVYAFADELRDKMLDTDYFADGLQISENEVKAEKQKMYINYWNGVFNAEVITVDNNGNVIIDTGKISMALDTTTVLNFGERVDNNDFVSIYTEISDYYRDIDELNRLEGEVNMAENVDTYNVNGSTEAKITWMINNFPEMMGLSQEELFDLEMPSEETISEYIFLYNKGFLRTPEDDVRFSELRSEILKYNTIISAFGNNMKTFIETIAEEDKDNSKVVNSTEEELTNAERYTRFKNDNIHFPLMSLVNDVAVLSLNEDGKHYISNYKPFPILEKLLLSEDGWSIQVVTISKGVATHQKVDRNNLSKVSNLLENRSKGTTVRVTISKDGEQIALVRDANSFGYYVTTDTLDTFLKVMDFKLQGKVSNYGYVMIMSRNSDGGYSPLKGNMKVKKFISSDVTTTMEPSVEGVEEVREGDKITVVYDPNDVFNTGLGNRSNSYKIKFGRMYLYDSKGRYLGTLRSFDNVSSRTKDEKLMAVRQMAYEAAGNIDASPNIEVVVTYNNFLNTDFDSDGNAKQYPIGNAKIKEYGFVKNGAVFNLDGSVPSIDVDLHSKGLPKDGVRRPVIVVDYYGKNALIPVSLKGFESKSIDITDPIQAKELLEEYGYWTDDMDIMDQDVQELLGVLNDDSKNSLTEDDFVGATSPVDVSEGNQIFSLAKIAFKYSGTISPEINLSDSVDEEIPLDLEEEGRNTANENKC